MRNLRSTLLLMAAGIIAGAAAVVAVGAQWSGLKRSQASDLVLAEPGHALAFPLTVHDGQRYLSDANGKPVLLRGDAAWSLIADLSREETEIYLADRRARGFNAILVNLLEHRFARRAPANFYGELPFHGEAAFTAPNEAYFAHVDWVLSRARALGLLVLLTPAYNGWQGNEDGWWQQMVAAGEPALHEYGRFLATRYGSFDNVLWVNGGDFDPPQKALVQALSNGIKEVAPQQLQTVHNGPETVVVDFWRDQIDQGWLDLLTLYTYEPICPQARALRARTTRPTFLIESFYENERETTAVRVRSQAYQALLCGVSGHVYGNNPIWHFAHEGIYPAPGNWWQNLGSAGAQSMTHLGNFFERLPWWRLEPDSDGQLLIGAERDSAVAARTDTGDLAVIYLPTAQSITVDLKHLNGAPVAATWFDPASGQRTAVEGSPFQTLQQQELKPPGRNADDESDWVLELRSCPVEGQDCASGP